MQAVWGACVLVATVGAMFSLLCRLSAMSGDNTPASVRHQHAVLFGALALSLGLPSDAARAVVALGVLLFLTLSAHRWVGVVPWHASVRADDDPQQPRP